MEDEEDEEDPNEQVGVFVSENELKLALSNAMESNSIEESQTVHDRERFGFIEHAGERGGDTFLVQFAASKAKPRWKIIKNS